MKLSHIINIGDRFHSLVVIGKSQNLYKQDRIFLCQCDCGNTKKIRAASLYSGKTKSCGCLLRAGSHTIHGDRKTDNTKRLYRIWKLLKQRCYNSNIPQFRDYGGRGITVCDEWNEYVPFRDWALANGYADDLTIDRINNNGNYEPSNCQWATMQEQARNTRRNRVIHGKSLAEWSEITGISQSKLWYRLVKSCWSFEDAISIQIGKTGPKSKH